MPERLAAPLTNARSDRVLAVRALAGRSVRSRTGRFLVEGPQAVAEAVRFAAPRVRDLYVTERAQDRWPGLVDAALAADLWVHPTADDVLARMSSDAQGVLAVVEHAAGGLGDLPGELRLVAIGEALADPGNVGTLIRAADAAGADAVVLTSGSAEVTAPKVVRSSAGSLFHLPVVTGVALAEVIGRLRGLGLTILAADGGAEHDVETSALLARPTAWVFGTEAHGLSEEARDLSDALVSVPLRGHAESLNVAMAATVCLYASSRAHAAASS